MTGELKIRPFEGAWVDAWERYGLSLESTALSRLMTPAPNKGAVENKSDIEHGKRVLRETQYKDERSVSLNLNITTRNGKPFLTSYADFCREVLDVGFFELWTAYNPTEVYRVTFLDCTQFSEQGMEIGKYTLSLNEPNPMDRAIDTNNDPRI